MLFPFCGARAARPRRSGNDFSALPTQIAADGSGPEASDHRRGIEGRSAESECVDTLCHCNENAAERENRTRPIAIPNQLSIGTSRASVNTRILASSMRRLGSSLRSSAIQNVNREA
jgi:hypothetical protein